MDCSVGLLFWSVSAILAGVLALLFGIVAWRDPNSSLQNRWVAHSQFDRAKFFGPLLGVVFTSAGLWLAVDQLQCRSYLQIPSLVELHWTWWPGIWPAMAIATAIGISNARQKTLVTGSLEALLAICFGIAVGEAAGFHVGVYADRWFAIAMGCALLSVLLWLVSSRFSAPVKKET